MTNDNGQSKTEAASKGASASPQHAPLEPIAIIGMGCRFPGAHGLKDYWDILTKGTDVITEVPTERWDINSLYNSESSVPGKVTSRFGGFLDRLEEFDASFFSISPREAPHVDPRQRVMLEIAWEALEDAGIPPDSLSGSKTGVFVATLTNDYDQIISRNINLFQVYTGTGTANSIVANRISYFLNLRGPSIALDTACSGSLVAVDLACKSLRSRESTIALAGGIAINLLPNGDIFFSRAGSLSPDGRCHTFDSNANGIVRSEGAGIVILKPLSEALESGDRIYALIRGSAVNHDGRSNGITSPNPEAQEIVISEAYRQAGISPGSVQYVEAHGTGTAVGDPIEVKSLISALGAGRPTGSPCVLGSVKSNIGHTESAAGVAGIIKVALALKNRLIPPNLHLNDLNPLIPASPFPVNVYKTPGAWPVPSEPLIAGVSSFGFGGTNAHVVLQEFAQPSLQQESRSSAWLLPLSARSPEALLLLARSYNQFLTDSDDNLSLADICYTAGVGRSHHEYRAAVVASSKEEMRNHLAAIVDGEQLPESVSLSSQAHLESPNLVFMFSGQGTHYEKLGRRLLEEEPVFRKSMQECDRLLNEHTGWSLIEKLLAADGDAKLGEVEVSQPTIFSFQVSLAALWRSWGIETAATIGQSLGEVAAAHVAGALDLKDAMLVVFHRSRLLRSAVGKGRTAVIGVSPDEAHKILEGIEGKIAVAGNTGPTSCIISGDGVAVEQVIALLKDRGVFCRLLEKLDTAAHSPQMDPLIGPLVEAVAGITPRPTSVPFISTVTAGPLEGQALTPAYWGRNLREPFRFWDGAKSLIGDGYDVFLEISYHPVLTGAVRQGFLQLGEEGITLPTLQRDKEERITMLSSLGAIYAQGYPVNWRLLFARKSQLVALPSYTWHRERYWYDQLTEGKSARPAIWPVGQRAGTPPLLGEHLQSSLSSGQHFWEMELGAGTIHYMSGHSVQGVILFPAAGYIEMALEATRELWGAYSCAIESVSFERPLVLSEDDTRRTQLAFSPTGIGEAEFQIASLPSDPEAKPAAWTIHTSGRLRLLNAEQLASKPAPVTLAEIKARCPQEVSSAEHYEAMRGRGLDYGPSFQAVRQLWSSHGEALIRIELPAALESETGLYQVHPVALDAAFQGIAATLPPTRGDTYLPQSADEVRVLVNPGSRLWCHIQLHPDARPGDETLKANLRLLDDEGAVCAEIEGLRLKRLDALEQAREKEARELVYEILWKPEARTQPFVQQQPDRRGSWIIFADSSGVGQALASLLESIEEVCILAYPGSEYRMAEDKSQCWLRPGSREDIERLFDDFLNDNPPCRAIAHLWGMESIDELHATPDEIAREQSLGCDTALAIAQPLAEWTGRETPRVWIITRGAQPAAGEVSRAGVGQATLWGLGRVMAREHAEFWGGLVDLQYSSPEDQAPLLLAEMLAPDDDNQVAFRGYERYAARLTRPGDNDNPARSLQFRPDGAYLITGGLTGLGLQVAYWMAEGGARRLILLSRTALPPRSTWSQPLDDDLIAGRIAAIRKLEMMGVSVHAPAADVSDQMQLSAFLQQYEQDGFPPIRGIIHSAGLIQDRLLMRMDAESFQKALRPKLYATRLLHRLTEHLPLDFFVMFSSVSSIIGQYGQSNYAAGNAFMDAFAHYRRQQGLPAISINWGPWAEVGIVARMETSQQDRFPGVKALKPCEGLSALGYLLDRDVAQALVLNADWRSVIQSPLLSELVSEQAESSGSTPDAEVAGLSLLELILADLDQRKSMIESYLRELIAKTMRLDPARLNANKPLTTLGMDSIMAVELKNKIEARLSLKLSLVDLFTASISKVADVLAIQLEGDERIGELLDEIEQLPMEALDSQFNYQEPPAKGEASD